MVKKVHLQKDPHAVTLMSYVLGFIWSLVFTVAAYMFTTLHLNTNHREPSDGVLLVLLAGLASAQLVVQLLYFLHIGKESKPRWNLIALLFAGLVVCIVLAGSVWIMDNLNYHMEQSPGDMDTRILKDEGFDNHGH